MGYKNKSNCFGETIFDQFAHFKREMTIGEVRALNYASQIAAKLNNSNLQKQYLDRIDKKLGLNSFEIEIQPEDFSKFISSLQTNKQLFEKNILVQAKMENQKEYVLFGTADESKTSHIFQVQIDPQSQKMLHNNPDGSKVLYQSEDLNRMEKYFDRIFLQIKSDIHSIDDLNKLIKRQLEEAEILNIKTAIPASKNSKTKYPGLL